MVYVPTQTEREKARLLLARLTPSHEQYRKYRADAAGYVGVLRDAMRRGGKLSGEQVTGFGLRASRLFPGMEYLVVYLDDSEYGRLWPEIDASAAPYEWRGHDWVQILRPPRVLIPDNKRRIRSQAFRSVLEHEYVHVNQMLLGAFPDEPYQGSAERQHGLFFARVRAEFEAYFVQWVNWNDQFPTSHGLSLEHFALLHAYAQTLEHYVRFVDDGSLEPREVLEFLQCLTASFPEEAERMGVDSALVPWFQERLSGFPRIALEVVHANHPQLAIQPGPRRLAILEWLAHCAVTDRS